MHFTKSLCRSSLQASQRSTTVRRYIPKLRQQKQAIRSLLSTTQVTMSQQKGFDTIALHGAYKPDTDVAYGMGHGAPRGVPLHRSTPFVFKSSEHAANLFALKELGNIYS